MHFAGFAYVYLLGLLPVLVVLYAYGSWRRRRALAAFVDAPLAARALPAIDTGRRWLKASCVVGAIASLVLALMQPQWGETEEDVPRRGRDLVIVLDASLSMLAEDAAPNRLEYAKSLLHELVARVRAEGGHRLALVDVCRPRRAPKPAHPRLRAVPRAPGAGRSGAASRTRAR